MSADTEACLELCETSMMELLVKIVTHLPAQS